MFCLGIYPQHTALKTNLQLHSIVLVHEGDKTANFFPTLSKHVHVHESIKSVQQLSVSFKSNVLSIVFFLHNFNTATA